MRETILVSAVVATFDDFSLFSVFFVFLSISAIFATLLFTGRPGGLSFPANPNRAGGVANPDAPRAHGRVPGRGNGAAEDGPCQISANTRIQARACPLLVFSAPLNGTQGSAVGFGI